MSIRQPLLKRVWEMTQLTSLYRTKWSLPFVIVSLAAISFAAAYVNRFSQTYVFFLYGIPIVYTALIFNLRLSVKLALFSYLLTLVTFLVNHWPARGIDLWGNNISNLLLQGIYFCACLLIGRVIIHERASQLKFDNIIERHQSSIELNKNIYRMHTNTIRALAAAIEAKDSYTKGHVERVTNHVVAMARELKLLPNDVRELMYASLLHDVGKIGVPENILCKPGRLNEEEWEAVKRHPDIGANIVSSMPSMDNIIPFVRHHHEHFNGNGYPHGLNGEKIPFGARLIAVADAFDAMVSERPYRSSFGSDYAVNELQRCSGSQFDPDAVDVFLKIINSKKEKKDWQEMASSSK